VIKILFPFLWEYIYKKVINHKFERWLFFILGCKMKYTQVKCAKNIAKDEFVSTADNTVLIIDLLV
jgi:hypothetical protein